MNTDISYGALTKEQQSNLIKFWNEYETLIAKEKEVPKQTERRCLNLRN